MSVRTPPPVLLLVLAFSAGCGGGAGGASGADEGPGDEAEVTAADPGTATDLGLSRDPCVVGVFVRELADGRHDLIRFSEGQTYDRATLDGRGGGCGFVVERDGGPYGVQGAYLLLDAGQPGETLAQYICTSLSLSWQALGGKQIFDRLGPGGGAAAAALFDEGDASALCEEFL